MPESLAAHAAHTPSPTYLAALVTSIIAVIVGVLELVVAAVAWYLVATDPSDHPFVDLGYLVALVVAVPGAVAVVLGALGWVFARRTAGLALGIFAVVAAAVPVLLAIP